MGTLSASNAKIVWTFQENAPNIATSQVEQEIDTLRKSVGLIETQIKLATNPKDIQYLNELLVYSEYAICALENRNY